MQYSLVKNQISSSASSLSCRRFSLGEIKRATNDFASEFHEFNIDHNGPVYRGNISGNSYNGEVLIMRYEQWLSKATLMLENEIKVLSTCHHVNIISLVGFCDEEGYKILVYEFMPINCSLYDYLHRLKNPFPRLTVEQRLEICLGVAKGLCYLHSSTDLHVVHGDINTRTVLLDASLVPKIACFSHATTCVAGPSSSQEITTNRTKGECVFINNMYASPECYELGSQVSQKADVYAFGIVFLEVLSEWDPSYKQHSLALQFIMNGELHKCTPENVKENITPACAWRCEKLVMNCLEFQPDKRPCMDQVVQELDLALKVQKDQDINFEVQSSEVNNLCRSFSLVEIERAKNELSNRLGEGAFGEVYRGKISSNGNNVDVAMKFLNTDADRGISSFEIEKKLLSACDHVNIISLVGYCDEKDKKVLLYQFMPNGSLYDYLYKPKDDTPQLTVDQRLEICLGVAKGLGYLHSRNDYNIIHSDLKTDNILLDANLVPKISDFGLSRTRVVGAFASSLITNNIQGTQGYIAPECYEPNYKLSRKADVYAFGVILLEVLCEKPAWERLVIWALPFLSKGELPKFTPDHVVKNISLECSRACANLIRDCLENDPNSRPCMRHVIANLDLILTLQKMKLVDDNCQKNKSQANSKQIFSLSEIRMATNEFAHQNLLKEMNGWRHTRKLFRGNISVDVAVKLSTWKTDNDVEFIKLKAEDYWMWKYEKQTSQNEIDASQNEINSLSNCHHANIISLLGYYDEPNVKILIYEFMPNGSLYNHVHSKQHGTILLTVEQRLEICLGVAKGLTYLHSSNIIHGFLNSKNILLNRNFVAKITGFEFSTKCVSELSTSQGITLPILGIMRHCLAPECNEVGYYASQKSDVYAFGVIVLEVLCESQPSTSEIASTLVRIMRGELTMLTPEHVGRYITRKCTQACEDLLRDCLDVEPDKRASMNQVVEKLEFALKLQKEGAN